jgi:hypothetical protein
VPENEPVFHEAPEGLKGISCCFILYFFIVGFVNCFFPLKLPNERFRAGGYCWEGEMVHPAIE